jgi:hypothetical protein
MPNEIPSLFRVAVGYASLSGRYFCLLDRGFLVEVRRILCGRWFHLTLRGAFGGTNLKDFFFL